MSDLPFDLSTSMDTPTTRQIEEAYVRPKLDVGNYAAIFTNLERVIVSRDPDKRSFTLQFNVRVNPTNNLSDFSAGEDVRYWLWLGRVPKSIFDMFQNGLLTEEEIVRRVMQPQSPDEAIILEDTSTARGWSQLRRVLGLPSGAPWADVFNRVFIATIEHRPGADDRQWPTIAGIAPYTDGAGVLAPKVRPPGTKVATPADLS